MAGVMILGIINAVSIGCTRAPTKGDNDQVPPTKNVAKSEPSAPTPTSPAEPETVLTPLERAACRVKHCAIPDRGRLPSLDEELEGVWCNTYVMLKVEDSAVYFGDPEDPRTSGPWTIATIEGRTEFQRLGSSRKFKLKVACGVDVLLVSYADTYDGYHRSARPDCECFAEASRSR